MAMTETDCERYRAELVKLIEDNTETSVLQTFENEFQVQAYARLKKHQERMKLFSVVFKIISEINVIIGAATVLVRIFI